MSAIENIDLEPDCSACPALCCAVFAFDRSESFGIDKAAGEVCPNLDADNRCRIFADRAELGFRGCITYTCHGAGQRVTREVFGGRTWRDDPALMHRMGAALSVLRRIHEQLVLLRAAARLPLGPDETAERSRLEALLTPPGDWTEAGLAVFPIEQITKDVAGWLRRLKKHVG